MESNPTTSAPVAADRCAAFKPAGGDAHAFVASAKCRHCINWRTMAGCDQVVLVVPADQHGRIASLSIRALHLAESKWGHCIFSVTIRKRFIMKWKPRASLGPSMRVTSPVALFQQLVGAELDHFHFLSSFYTHVTRAADDFPAYVFIEPRYNPTPPKR